MSWGNLAQLTSRRSTELASPVCAAKAEYHSGAAGPPKESEIRHWKEHIAPWLT